MQATQPITCRDFVDHSTELLEGVLPSGLVTGLAGHARCCHECRRYVAQVASAAGWGHNEMVLIEPPSRSATLGFLSLVPPSDRTPIQDAGPAVSWSDGCIEVDEELARAFFEDRLVDDEQLLVLQHLVAGCATCASVCAQVAYPELSRESAFARFPQSGSEP